MGEQTHGCRGEHVVGLAVFSRVIQADDYRRWLEIGFDVERARETRNLITNRHLLFLYRPWTGMRARDSGKAIMVVS